MQVSSQCGEATHSGLSSCSWPDAASAYNLGISWAANDTGMVFAWIKHVPNQSLMFYVGKYEHVDSNIIFPV